MVAIAGILDYILTISGKIIYVSRGGKRVNEKSTKER